MCGGLLGGIALDVNPSVNNGNTNAIAYAAKKKKKNMTFYFDWRNDNGLFDESSFNGASLIISAYQNGEDLKDNYEKLINDTNSDLSFDTEKNTTLDLSFKYKLVDKSPVTIKMMPLEGVEKKFSFDIK